MSNFKFGNYLTELRTNSGLSQTELGQEVGVSNKAVSKWENGKSKPSLEVLNKLSKLFNEPLEKIVEMINALEQKQITKIVVTGGPCAGKTTAMSKIQSYFTSRGYAVIFVPETATEIIKAGLNPDYLTDMMSFE